ncbi:MAG: hypothetical protein IKL36_03690, partial [Clostridia bacterium]|nr:hypothetical protein [Clostridia bacterium]
MKKAFQKEKDCALNDNLALHLSRFYRPFLKKVAGYQGRALRRDPQIAEYLLRAGVPRGEASWSLSAESEISYGTAINFCI